MDRRHFLHVVASLSSTSLAACPKRGHQASPSTIIEHRDHGPGRVLDEAQWKTLAAFCARLIPTDQDPGATEANVVNFIDGQLDAPYIDKFVKEMVAGLEEMDRLAPQFGGTSFIDLPAEGQDKLIAELRRGRKIARRYHSQHFFMLVMTLALEGMFSHPIYGGNRDMVGWKLIDRIPRKPHPRRPYRSHEKWEPRHGAPLGPDLTHQGEVDVVVVGSGAGGAPVALQLARAGYRVVILEKGPAYDQRDFINDEIAHCRRNFFVPYPSEEPHVLVDARGKANRTNRGWTSCCVGGGTVHFSGFTYRLHPEDLKLRSMLGEVSGSTLADWPIAWEELLPYYERMEIELGVSGDARRNPFETFRRPLPLPPLPENGFARLLDQVTPGLGLHPYPTARSIPSRSWQGRSKCQLSFFCGSYGCEVGAKSSTLNAIIPKAVATGKCQVRPLSHVHALELNEQGQVAGVRYFDQRGNEHRLGAAVVVLACSPIETSRLMLLSKQKGHPDGLANEQGLVGRNLMFTGYGAAIAEYPHSDPRIGKIDWRQPFVNRSFQDYYWLDRGKSTMRKGGTLNYLLPHANPISTSERYLQSRANPIWGKKLKDVLRNYYLETRELELEVFSETLPTLESRVTLDPQIKDKWGLPVSRFKEQPHPLDLELNRELVNKGMAIMDALKPKAMKATRIGQTTPWLQAGTCRFGDDPKTSVLDRDCRAHSIPNLFVTDGSFMPTSSAIPNTLTVEANALRVADRIIALGKAHALFKSKT